MPRGIEHNGHSPDTQAKIDFVKTVAQSTALTGQEIYSQVKAKFGRGLDYTVMYDTIREVRGIKKGKAKKWLVENGGHYKKNGHNGHNGTHKSALLPEPDAATSDFSRLIPAEVSGTVLELMRQHDIKTFSIDLKNVLPPQAQEKIMRLMAKYSIAVISVHTAKDNSVSMTGRIESSFTGVLN